MNGTRHEILWGYRYIYRNTYRSVRDADAVQEMVSESDRYNERLRYGPERCDCTVRDACKQQCLNRNSGFECNPPNCVVTCSNQVLQRLATRSVTEPPITLKYDRQDGYGLGIFSTRVIRRGETVGEFKGCYVSVPYGIVEVDSPYVYDLDVDQRIEEGERWKSLDAGKEGNELRFLNHSCEPNVGYAERYVGNDARLKFVALEAIQPGTRLTVDYGDDFFKQTKCVCPACVAVPPRFGVESRRNARR